MGWVREVGTGHIACKNKMVVVGGYGVSASAVQEMIEQEEEGRLK
jgi:hypothetical protein